MKVSSFVMTAVGMLLLARPALASITYDANVTPDVIFGSGNANGSFTVDQNNGIELGLRAKLRHNASGLPENTFNSNGDGTYSFDAGVAPTQSFPTAVWSFEWSINSDFDGNGLSLKNDTFFYELSIDTDPGIGTSFIAFDPINIGFADHAIGNNSTGNGAGSVAADATEYAALIANNNVAQNSWKPHWVNPGFNPTVAGTYDFVLSAVDDSGTRASTSIQVIVGAVPEPAALFTWAGLALCGCACVWWRKKQQVD